MGTAGTDSRTKKEQRARTLRPLGRESRRVVALSAGRIAVETVNNRDFPHRLRLRRRLPDGPVPMGPSMQKTSCRRPLCQVLQQKNLTSRGHSRDNPGMKKNRKTSGTGTAETVRNRIESGGE